MIFLLAYFLQASFSFLFGQKTKKIFILLQLTALELRNFNDILSILKDENEIPV